MKRKPFGERLAASMADGLAALKKGNPLPSSHRLALPRPPAFKERAVAEIRSSLGLTQSEFSRLVMVSPKTIQSREEGTRKPSGMALRLLQILQSPEALDPILRHHAAAAQK